MTATEVAPKTPSQGAPAPSTAGSPADGKQTATSEAGKPAATTTSEGGLGDAGTPAKPAEDGGLGGETNGEQQKQPEGAPEKYADFTVPDGADALDPEVVSVYGEVAKDLKLSQSQAQSVLDKMLPAMTARNKAAQDQMAKQWGEQAAKDKEYGGEKYAENLAVARKAYESHTTPEYRALLKATKLDRHPETIRTFYRIGRQVGDDEFVSGKPASQVSADPAKRMYPNMQ